MLVKYASNAFHGMKIAFANEVGSLCEAAGASPLEVMKVFCEDTSLNISRAYLRPGFAFGGSCLPKDIRALLSLGRSNGIHLPLLEGVLEANHLRIVQAANAIVKAKPKQVTLLGLSFKKGTDDLRESPYLLLAERLLGGRARVEDFRPGCPAGSARRQESRVRRAAPTERRRYPDGRTRRSAARQRHSGVVQSRSSKGTTPRDYRRTDRLRSRVSAWRQASGCAVGFLNPL